MSFASAAGGFLNGAVGGAQTGWAFQDYLKRRQEADQEKEAKPSQSAVSFADGVIKGDAQPFDTGDPVAGGLAPHQKAFLNATAGGESGGRYNVRFSPGGPVTFDGYDKHPGIMEAGPHGPSSAAGRYQFTRSTWDDMGGGSFSPARQDIMAMKLAKQRYHASTGRDLDADLRTHGLTRSMMTTLSPTWAAFGSNQDRHIATYNASLNRYTANQPPPKVAQNFTPTLTAGG